MIDSDDVLLLRPGSSRGPFAFGAPGVRDSLIVVTVHSADGTGEQTAPSRSSRNGSSRRWPSSARHWWRCWSRSRRRTRSRSCRSGKASTSSYGSAVPRRRTTCPTGAGRATPDVECRRGADGPAGPPGGAAPRTDAAVAAALSLTGDTQEAVRDISLTVARSRYIVHVSQKGATSCDTTDESRQRRHHPEGPEHEFGGPGGHEGHDHGTIPAGTAATTVPRPGPRSARHAAVRGRGGFEGRGGLDGTGGGGPSAATCGRRP